MAKPGGVSSENSEMALDPIPVPRMPASLKVAFDPAIAAAVARQDEEPRGPDAGEVDRIIDRYESLAPLAGLPAGLMSGLAEIYKQLLGLNVDETEREAARVLTEHLFDFMAKYQALEEKGIATTSQWVECLVALALAETVASDSPGLANASATLFYEILDLIREPVLKPVQERLEALLAGKKAQAELLEALSIFPEWDGMTFPQVVDRLIEHYEALEQNRPSPLAHLQAKLSDPGHSPKALGAKLRLLRDMLPGHHLSDLRLVLNSLGCTGALGLRFLGHIADAAVVTALGPPRVGLLGPVVPDPRRR
jgi:hypothetical protein